MLNPHSPRDSLSGNTDLIVRGTRVITAEGERAAAIHIRNGVIVGIAPFQEIQPNCDIYEAGDLVVMPGLVDTHVHINEPGRPQWEGFASATRAAAAGGVTTLIEMPLNSIPATTSVPAFQEKIDATDGKLSVDTGFWGGAVPGNAQELHGLWQAGCFGFKCFLVESGVPEFAFVTETDLREALPVLAELGAPLLVHAELPQPIETAKKQKAVGTNPRSYKTWLDSRPRAAENLAINLLLDLAGEFGVSIHVVHLSSSDVLPMLRSARADRLKISVETCPHYLVFTAEDIPDGATQFKCAPPIRESGNRVKLWSGLADGIIDMIATDHSPCPPEMKQQQTGNFLNAWGGISSLQLSLSIVWTEACRRGYSLSLLAKWLCAGPARLAGLQHKKGAIAIGHDADLVIWNPDARFQVDPAKLLHRHKLTPYADRELMGIVETTFLRGQKIFERGELLGSPTGRLLLRGKA
jgi:allantoinase